MIYLYNTLTKKKEEFKPVKDGEVSMYNCGPTVYDYAHIGNLRAYVFADILRRTFEYSGLKVKQVINITDVGHLSSDSDSGEDKMTKALIREEKPLTLEAMKEVADFYFEKFKEDLRALNIETPEVFPKASEHVKEMLAMIEILDKKGFVYKTSDGLYFETDKFNDYGKLGGLDSEDTRARVVENTEKKNPRDFALWKFNQNLGWESPYGKGFPGWHIECSAMSEKYLGQPFDIHTGGIDHISVHHNNEIAQSECAFDKPLANIWMHNAFLTTKDGKMAKSEGNFITLKTLAEKNINPLAYRYWLLTAHYQTTVDFSLEAISASENALDKMKMIYSELPLGGEILKEYTKKFAGFIYDDLDTPKALALAWELIKDSSVSSADKKTTLTDFNRVLGLSLSEISTVEIPEEIKKLAEERELARKEKNWKKSDELRVKIESAGFRIKDSEEGYKISK